MKQDPKPKKMGRPPKEKGTTKPHVISARFTDAEHARIKRKANGQRLSAFARTTLLDAARRHG